MVILTSGPSGGNTVMELYDSSLNQIGIDDDGGTGLYSRIDRVCGTDELPAGTYYVKIDEVGSDDEIPSYDISLTVTPCGIQQGEVAIVGSWTSGLSHAVESGTNRVLLFTAHVENNGTISLNSVTYGDQPMTRIIDFNQGSSYRAYTAAFILDEVGIAAASNSSFSPSWSSSTTRTPGYSSVFLTGVDQANMINDSDGSGANSQASVSTAPLTTAAGDLVIVAGTSGNTGSYAVNNGFTEAIELAMSSSDGVVGYKSATGSNETPSVTQSNANRQAVIGFVVSNGNGI